jgi:hypothetical protein
MIKVALSHDVDRTYKSYQYLTKSIRKLIHLNFKGLSNQIHAFFQKDIYWNFEDIIEIENSKNDAVVR